MRTSFNYMISLLINDEKQKKHVHTCFWCGSILLKWHCREKQQVHQLLKLSQWENSIVCMSVWVCMWGWVGVVWLNICTFFLIQIILMKPVYPHWVKYSGRLSYIRLWITCFSHASTNYCGVTSRCLLAASVRPSLTIWLCFWGWAGWPCCRLWRWWSRSCTSLTVDQERPSNVEDTETVNNQN